MPTCIMSDSSSLVPATVPAEPLAISEVDADVVQPEKLGKMHVQTQLQTILATYCVEHKERAYVQPNQFRVWMQRVFPADNQPKSKNTVFHSVLAKRCKLELKTARMAFSDLAPSKQETSLGTAYRHLEIIPFPERLRTPPADRLDPSPEDIEGYDAWLFLKESASPALETLNWTPNMLKGWLEESDFAVKKPALQKKVPLFPPLPFIHKPHESLCAIINNVFAQDPQPRFVAVSRARITVLHMPDHDQSAGKCWDEVECGTYTLFVTPPKGHFFDLNYHSQVHESGFLWAIEFRLLAKPPAVPEPPRKKQRSVLQLWQAAWQPPQPSGDAQGTK